MMNLEDEFRISSEKNAEVVEAFRAMLVSAGISSKILDQVETEAHQRVEDREAKWARP
jgi:hypothetical protein